MSTMSMIFTHIELGVGSYLAGILTTVIIVFLYEKLMPKYASSGVKCDECHGQLNASIRRATSDNLSDIPGHRF